MSGSIHLQAMSATGGVVFLNILQISQENTSLLESLFIKLAGVRPATLLKRDSNTGVVL